MEDLDFAFIGQRIRELRNEKMLTQEYVANAVDVNVACGQRRRGCMQDYGRWPEAFGNWGTAAPG